MLNIIQMQPFTCYFCALCSALPHPSHIHMDNAYYRKKRYPRKIVLHNAKKAEKYNQAVWNKAKYCIAIRDAILAPITEDKVHFQQDFVEGMMNNRILMKKMRYF